MKILLASSEVHPFSKTGGLADMVGSLSKALAAAGNRVGIVTPLYRGIREKFPKIQRADWHFDLPMDTKRVGAELWSLEAAKGLTIYFIHKPEYFDRAGIYNEKNADYPDNGERFIFFSKCVAHLARYLPWQPEIVHSNDWQTGLLPALVSHGARAEGWGNAPKTCHTIHNLAYQGVFKRVDYALTNLPLDFFHTEGAEFHGMLNCLKAGITFADVVTTVSPRYAREITTQEYGEGLDGVLRKKRGRVVGILNGVDYDEWNTTKNRCIHHPYSARRLAGKTKTKAELQKEMGLAVDAKLPLFGTITRLAEQKGIDIELGAIEEMIGAKMQFVLLGSGSPDYERALTSLAKRHPGKVAVRIGYDHALAHRIEAACDFYLMPSKFEPCGLNQMYSLRYGAIPIVRRTGGLDDSVIDASDDSASANGIKFTEYSSHALSRAIRKALHVYNDPKLLAHYRRAGMTADFSWDSVVGQYLDCYDLAGRH